MVVRICVLFQLGLTCGISMDERTREHLIRETISHLLCFRTTQVGLALSLHHPALGIVGVRCL